MHRRRSRRSRGQAPDPIEAAVPGMVGAGGGCAAAGAVASATNDGLVGWSFCMPGWVSC